jgi:hypothetical protein
MAADDPDVPLFANVSDDDPALVPTRESARSRSLCPNKRLNLTGAAIQVFPRPTGSRPLHRLCHSVPGQVADRAVRAYLVPLRLRKAADAATASSRLTRGQQGLKAGAPSSVASRHA